MSGDLGSCETCAGRCCRSYLVPLTGYDVWRISMNQRLGPEQFTVAYPNREPGARGFLLQAGGTEMALALDKQGRFRALAPCVFLLLLGGDTQRCGIYEDRPTACRIYPMGLAGGRVVQRPDTFCPPGSWALDSAGSERWGQGLRRARLEMEIYAGVIDRWNQHAELSPARQFGLTEYLNYVLNAYDLIAGLERRLGVRGMSAVVASWPVENPRPGGGTEPWQDYLDRTHMLLSRCLSDLGSSRT